MTTRLAEIDPIQDRRLPVQEFTSFCDNLVSTLHSNNVTECLSGLRRLSILLLHSSRLRDEVPQQLQDALVQVVLNSNSHWWLQKTICAYILSEIAPKKDIHILTAVGSLPWDHRQIPFILWVAGNQILIEEDKIQPLVSQSVRWLSTTGYTVEAAASALSFLETVARTFSHLLTKEHVNVTNTQMKEWLRHASTKQAINPYSRGLFKKEEQSSITEIDGIATKNFFTVLCIGQYYTPDQVLNIMTFSGLRGWLRNTSHLTSDDLDSASQGWYSGRTSSPFESWSNTPPKLPESPSLGYFNTKVSLESTGSSGDLSGSSSRPSSAAEPRPPSVAGSTGMSSISLAMGAHKGSLAHASLQYALRVVDQCERKPKVSTDAEVQLMALQEAVVILDELCTQYPDSIPKVFNPIKRIYNTVSRSQPRIALHVVQFFINHSHAVEYDASQVYEYIFESIPAKYYASPAVSFEFLTFLRNNLEFFCLKTDLLPRYFPNILKILAWSPRTYAKDFEEIIAACMSSASSVEIFHTLLDLPCCTGVLELSRHSLHVQSSSDGEVSLIPPSAADAFRDPLNRPLFNFLTRVRGGQGDTIDRLGNLHRHLSGLATHTRVVQCTRILPNILRIVLDIILQEAEEGLVTDMLPVILERTTLLYAVPSYVEATEKVLVDHMVNLVKMYPGVVKTHFQEILEFLSNTDHIMRNQLTYITLVNLVGDYLCTVFIPSCTPDIISKMYESLETVGYEVVRDLQHSNDKGPRKFHPRFVTTLMSTLAKLGSRSQDLIPRVVLCISKLSHAPGHWTTDEHRIITRRAIELINLLRLPNVASVVLSPPKNVTEKQLHRSSTSLPVLLRAVTNIVTES